jgi:hypothetical protein
MLGYVVATFFILWIVASALTQLPNDPLRRLRRPYTIGHHLLARWHFFAPNLLKQTLLFGTDVAQVQLGMRNKAKIG